MHILVMIGALRHAYCQSFRCFLPRKYAIAIIPVIKVKLATSYERGNFHRKVMHFQHLSMARDFVLYVDMLSALICNVLSSSSRLAESTSVAILS